MADSPRLSESSDKEPIRVLVRAEIVSRRYVERVIEVEEYRDAWARRESALTPYIPAGYRVVRYDSEQVDDAYPSRGAAVVDVPTGRTAQA